MRHFILIFTLLILTQLAKAQIENHKRFELEYEWQSDDYLLISNEKLGLSLVKADYYDRKVYLLSITQLGTDLNQKWEKSVLIDRGFELMDYYFIDGKTYFVLQEFPNKSRVKIISIDNRTGETLDYNSNKILELDIKEFKVIQNTAIIGGYFQSRPLVFGFDLRDKRIMTLPNIYQNESELLEMRINNDSLTFNVLATEFNENQDQTIIVNTYDYLGNSIRDYELETKSGYHLTSAVSSSINDISQVVVGTYSYQAINSPAGLFINHVDKTGTQTMKYYSYGELENFFSHLGKRKVQRYRKRAENAKSKNKEVEYQVQPLLSTMVEEDDQLIIFGEFLGDFNLKKEIYESESVGVPFFFHSDYHLNLDEGYRHFLDADENSQQKFTYKFSHAYSLALDKLGNILWDDWAEVSEDGEGIAEPFGGFNWHKGQGTYAYYYEKEVYAKTMDDKKETSVIVNSLELNEPDDKLNYENEGSTGTIRWYDNYFLVYGVQSIRSAEKNGEAKKVFFINKISLNPNKDKTGDD